MTNACRFLVNCWASPCLRIWTRTSYARSRESRKCARKDSALQVISGLDSNSAIVDQHFEIGQPSDSSQCSKISGLTALFVVLLNRWMCLSFIR